MPAFTLIPCAIEPKTRFQRVRYPKCSPTPKSGLAKTLSDVKSATYKMQCEISGLAPFAEHLTLVEQITDDIARLKNRRESCRDPRIRGFWKAEIEIGRAHV